MINNLLISLKFFFLSMIGLGVVYPLIVYAFGAAFFPYQASGSLIKNNNQVVIGSELIGQKFSSNKYFWPRPSTIEYDAMQGGGMKYSLSSEQLKSIINEKYKLYYSAKTPLVPIDLITSSASGLDPHISFNAALIQMDRVSIARKIDPARLKIFIEENSETSILSGSNKRVNVLKLNLELDRRFRRG